MVRRPHHTGFTVADLERTIEFYRDGLGLQVANRIPGPKAYHSDVTGYADCHLEIAFMSVPNGPPVEFIEYKNPQGPALDMETYRPGNGHLAFVVDDLKATIEKLTKLGGTPRSKAPIEVPSGPNKGATFVYLRDPDGITLELFEFSG